MAINRTGVNNAMIDIKTFLPERKTKNRLITSGFLGIENFTGMAKLSEIDI
jgi:hypothetical protein